MIQTLSRSPLRFPLAFVLGLLMCVSFAPYSLWPVQLVGLGSLLVLVLSSTRLRDTALFGALFGCGWMLAGVRWLYHSMHIYGSMPVLLSLLTLLLFCLVLLAPFFAACFATTKWLSINSNATAIVQYLMIWPASWLLFEWLRGWVLTGFPWLSSGYAWIDTPLAGYAPILGVYGIGGLVALLTGAICLLFVQKSAWPFAACVLIVVPSIGAILSHSSWTTPHGGPINVRLLQGNISQSIKFDESQLSRTIDFYRNMILAAPADLIATPETALPIFQDQFPQDFNHALTNFVQTSHSHLLLGLFLSNGPDQYGNGLIGLRPNLGEKNPIYYYRKHHLVPFGEYVPPGFHWLVHMMGIPLADQVPAPLLQDAFAVKDQWVLPNICYENVFGNEIADQIYTDYKNQKGEPTLLFNASNLAWFANSAALPQHLEIARFRALEVGRPVLLATNTGPTAIINANAHVLEILPFGKIGVLSTSIQGFAGITPYIRFGNTLAVGSALLTLISVFLSGFFRNTRKT